MSQPRQVPIEGGRVFCRLKGGTVPLDVCLDCPDIKAINERGHSPFIICDSGRRPDDDDGGQLVLNWWLRRGRRPVR
ncbi:MAG TPA: hypothetical protein VJP45_01850 [Candidatus Limnocylindria bacterium]|nr:hypothetical protein [Candidatus Limnocylindria bacterium]